MASETNRGYNMDLIKVNNLHYSYVSKYQTVHALKGVDCTFEKGLFYAITGPSGSGKTTLMSLLAGLDVPSDGNIYVEDVDMQKMNKDEFRRKNASVIYQAYNLFPLLNALENVMYPMQANKVPKKEALQKAKECMEMVGLGENNWKQYPQMMSGGEQQRVAIARAMACGGDILLADEPTGNLDTENEKNVIEILKDLAHKSGKLVIVITHNLAVAEAADVQYKMKDGKLEKDLALNIAICDSDVKFTSIVEDILQKKTAKMNVNVETEVFFDGRALLNNVQNGNKYDLIFLDIEVDHIDGIEVARDIRKNDKNVLFIYISDNEQSWKELFEVNPFRFLSKPLDTILLATYFEAAIEKITTEDVYFQYTFNKRVCKVLLNDVVYFESRNRMINIFFADGSSSSFYGKLNEIEDDIVDSNSQFLRIHQSYLINCNFVREAISNNVTLTSAAQKTVLKISRERQSDVRSKLYRIAGEKIQLDD